MSVTSKGHPGQRVLKTRSGWGTVTLGQHCSYWSLPALADMGTQPALHSSLTATSINHNPSEVMFYFEM